MTSQIHDQGYRSYDGVRRGRAGAMRSLAWHTVLRALGLRRSAWAKVLPLASVVIAYLPATIFVGVTVLLPAEVRRRAELPTYHEYYGFITAAIVLFVALVGPEVLCSDRRHGMLGLYLASPLDRGSYLMAKVLAVLPVLGLVTLGPPLLLLVGLTIADNGPAGAGEFLTVLVRIVVSGVVISALFTSFSLAVSSFTERRAVASAGIVLSILATSVAAHTLVERAGADQRLFLLDPFFLPFELVQRVYGVAGDRPGITTASLVFAEIAWTVGASVILAWRYHTMDITR